MSYPLETSVLREIERLFAPELVDCVRSQLAERSLPMVRSAPAPRVHIAILWLSKGDLKHFESALDGACCDWRDTLVAAGLGNGDWRQVLARKEIDCRDW